MISLIITLFICLFSFCPSLSKVEDHELNNLSTTYVEKRSATWEEHSGYITSMFELADDEVWFNMEDIFGDVFPQFDYNTYTSYTDYLDIPSVNGLYALIPVFYENQHVYSMYESWVITNYSGYKVNSITLANKIFTWENGYSFYSHRIWFHLANGQHLLIDWHTDGNNRTGTYTLNNQLYSSGYTLVWENQFNSSLFCADDFSYSFVFKNSDTWDRSAEDINNYQEGYRAGYDTALGIGDSAGYSRGYDEGYDDGQPAGYNEGLSHADYDSTALTIMSGIIDVALLPVNVFLMILNFEVFGVNISGAVSALLTISIVIIICIILMNEILQTTFNRMCFIYLNP